MNKKTRQIILIFCVICFFILAPILVLYSMGYGYDFKKGKITETGGIYVRTFPAADKITVDSNISKKLGFLANSIFVQRLLPKNHSVYIEKSGYYDYSKTLPVEKKLTTKLENILLIKKNIAFSDVTDNIDYFSIAPNQQNIIASATGTKSTTFSYFNLNNQNKPQTFSIIQYGFVSNIKWSDDSSRALIKIQNGGIVYYYLFDSTLQKPTATRLSYLDYSSQQISFSPQDSQTLLYIKDKTLFSAKKNSSLPIINNVISFKISGSNITWLSSKGALSNSDLSGKITSILVSENFPVNNQNTYEIVSFSNNTFLRENDSLFKLNQETKKLESYKIPPLSGYKIMASGDGKNAIYWNNNQIYTSTESKLPATETPKEKFGKLFSGSQVSNLQWLNNDYIIFSDGDKIIISEIDYRGNINAITLQQTISLSGDKKVDIKNPSMFFSSQSGKLYVLTNNILISSEKIIP